MRPLRLAWFVTTFALACSGPERAARAPHPGRPHLTVMSYNVNFGIAGDPETLALIEGAGADLVLLQETTPAWEAAIRARLGPRYPFMAFRHSEAWPAGGLAVLSKRPFVDAQLIPSPVGWFPAWRIVAETPIGPVQALNVHLRPPLSDPSSFARGYFSTRKDRRAEIEAYVERLDRSLPTLVCGDFNEDEDGRAVGFLASRGMSSALPELRPDADTWQWHTSVGPIRSRLDHVVYDRAHLDPLDVRVLEAGSSDHFPLVAIFEKR